MLIIDQLRACELFAGLPESTLQSLADASSVTHLSGGHVLFRQGDPGDALYLVVLGRLCALLESEGRPATRLGEIGPGEYVGEMALIASVPRGATIQALRDSTLIRISDAAFLRAVQASPEAALAVARTVIHRSRPSPRARHDFFRTLAIVSSGASTAEGLQVFVRQLGAALAEKGTVTTLDTAAARELLVGGQEGAATDLRLSEVEHRLEEANQFTIYSADESNPTWRERCIRNGDRILVVASTDSPESEREQIVRLLRKQEHTGQARMELIMLHPNGEIVPGRVGPWLDTGLFSQHYHVRGPQDVDRLARFLTGSATGIAFSGGGGRVAAFVGILAAYEEASVPFDIFAGTSGGAIVGAVASMELKAADLKVLMGEFSRMSLYSDAGPPFVSLSSSRNISRVFKKLYGNVLIEDLPRPFQAACTSLSTGELVVPKRGELWRVVRASTSLPGIYPPVPFGNDLLVDGGLVNNLPADLLRGLCTKLIGADVSVAPPLVVPPPEAYRISGWRLFWRKLNPFSRPPSDTVFLGATVIRAALAGARIHQNQMASVVDTMITPQVTGIGLMDVQEETFSRLFSLGYEAGKASLQKPHSLEDPVPV